MYISFLKSSTVAVFESRRPPPSDPCSEKNDLYLRITPYFFQCYAGVPFYMIRMWFQSFVFQYKLYRVIRWLRTLYTIIDGALAQHVFFWL